MRSVQTPLAKLLADRRLTHREVSKVLDTGEAQISKWCRGLTPGPYYRKLFIRKLKLTEAEIAALGWAEKETSRV